MALVTNTIGSTTGTYPTITLWEADNPGLGTDIWHGQIVDNETFEEEVALTANDAATATSYIWLDVHPDVRHDGRAGSGAKIQVTGTAPTQGEVISIGTDYGRISGLEIYLGAAATSDEGIGIAPAVGGTTDGVLVEDCLIWTDTGVDDTDGIYAGNDNTELTVVNTVFQGWERGGIHMQNSSASTRTYTVNAYHCCFIDGASDSEGGGAFVADCPNASSTQNWNIYNCVSPVAAGGLAEGEVFVVSNNTGTVTWDGDNNLVGKTTAQVGTDTMAGNILLDEVTGYPMTSGNHWIVRDPITTGLRDMTTVFEAAAGNGVIGAALDQQGTPTDTRADLSVDILGNTRPTTAPDIGPWHSPGVTLSQPSLRSSTTTATTVDVTSFNVTLPATVESGDLLLVAVGTGSGDGINTPVGWTAIENTDDPGNAATIILGKVADGTEDGTTLTVTWSGSSGAGAWAGAISGWDGTLTNLVSTGVVGTSSNIVVMSTALANPSAASAVFGFVGFNKADTVTVDTFEFGMANLDSAFGTGASLASLEGGISVYASGVDAVANTRTQDVEALFTSFPNYAFPYVIVPAGGNVAPDTPTITSPTDAASVSDPFNVTITYNDADGDPQAQISVRRKAQA